MVFYTDFVPCLDTCRWNLVSPEKPEALTVLNERSYGSKSPQEPLVTLCVESKVYSRCHHGPLCTYAHHISELGIQTPVNILYNMAPCGNYLSSGKCHAGKSCQFAHVDGKLHPKSWKDHRMIEHDVSSIDDSPTISPNRGCHDQTPSLAEACAIHKLAPPEPPIDREKFRKIDFFDFSHWYPHLESLAKPATDAASAPATAPTPEQPEPAPEDPPYHLIDFILPEAIPLKYDGPEPTPDRGNDFTPYYEDHKYPLPFYYTDLYMMTQNIIAYRNEPWCIPTRNRDDGFDPFFY
uniref:C3H1-type domain-containing protein n=1 Tax=Panagrellus redivivus TaxID=6233 RepID=A0A7E4ZXN7_PANRE